MAKPNDIEALGRSIAYDACCSWIDSSCVRVMNKVEASWDNRWFAIEGCDPAAEDDVKQAVQYLEGRGLLLRHPQRPGLVQMLDESEPQATGEPQWLSAPDSEGWWWHLWLASVNPRWVRFLMGRAGEGERLYVTHLGVYAEDCGGLWQKMPQPVLPSKSDKGER